MTVTINGIAYVIEVTDPVETYPVWFNGEQITSANCDDVLKDGGSVKYDPVAKTMTLNNPVNYYPASTKALIIADGTDLTVTGNAVLNKWHINNGINMINGADLIFDNANIVFDRPEYPVYANPGSDVTIQNSNIEALANYYFGMRADHITVKNSTVKAGGSNYGLVAYYGLVVEDGYVDSSATIVHEGDAVINGGTMLGSIESVTGDIIINRGTVLADADRTWWVYGNDFGLKAEGAIRIGPGISSVIAQGEYALLAGDSFKIDPSNSVDPDTLAYTVTKSWYAGYITFRKSSSGPIVPADYVEILPYGSHRIEYNANGHGEDPVTRFVKDGGTAPVPIEPKEKGYSFGGWYTEAGCINEYDFTQPVYNDMILYAKWYPDVKVLFDIQGHGSYPSKQVFPYGGTATQPADPYAEGYTFAGWYTDAACTTGYDFSTPVTADITLYARWLVNVKGFRIHADGTKLDGTYYILNTDVLEPVFEKDTEEAAVELGHLCTDSSCCNVITAPPEKGTTYFFMVYLKDVSSFEKGIQKIRFLSAIVENIDASAEDAVIEFDGLVSSAAEDAVTLLFKYTEYEILYTISKGANASWTKGTSAGVDYTVNRNINDDKTYGLFESIEVDGKILDASQYTAASGSLSASLKAAYLETLSEGDHTVTFHFKDGSVGTKLTIKPKPSVKAAGSAGSSKTSVKSGSSGSAKTSVKSGSSGSAKSTGKTSPRTGDRSNPMLWIVLLILAVASMVGLAVWRRRHKA